MRPEPDLPPSESEPIEVVTDHVCLLGRITDELAERARAGVRGDALAERATGALAALTPLAFERCCVPAYIALAPQRFTREIQLPIAGADACSLDTRVLLWPAGAADAQHPHRDGWAVVMRVRGLLIEYQRRHGAPQPERAPQLYVPELITPEEGVTHHIRNTGDQVGLTIHIFGK